MMIEQDDEDEEYQDRPAKRKRNKTGPAFARKRTDCACHPSISITWKTVIAKNKIVLKRCLISYFK